MAEYKKWFMLGAVAGVLSPVLVWLAGMIPVLNKWLTPYVTGVNTDLANYVLALLGGQIQMPGIVVAAVGGGIFMALGAWLYDLKITPDKIPFVEGRKERLILTMFYASLAASLLLIGLKLPTWPTLITMTVNAIITSLFIDEVLVKRLKLASI